MRIDFSKPHDFHFRFYNGADVVFHACILVGFSSPVDGGGNRLGSEGEWGHDRWLVLRQPDGRMAYAPREGLQYIVESGPAG